MSSYIADEFKKTGQIRNNVAGWYFESTGEFRPLNDESIVMLCDAGLVSAQVITDTHIAHLNHQQRAIEDYMLEQNMSDCPSSKELHKMKSTFGSGVSVTNFLTGRTINL